MVVPPVALARPESPGIRGARKKPSFTRHTQAFASSAWDRVLRLPSWLILAALSFATLLRVGFGAMPNIHNQYKLLVDPFSNPLPSGDSYIWWNWLSPFLGHLLGLRSGGAYLIFCAVIALAILPASYLAFRVLGVCAVEARWRMLLLTSLPASFTALLWLGMDALTLLLLVLVVAARGRIILGLTLGVLCGLQHAEQSFLAIGLLAVASWVSDRRGVRNAAAALVGVVIGKVVLMVIAAYAGGQPIQNRWDYFVVHHAVFFHQFLGHAPLIAWSVFGAGWLVLWCAGLARRQLVVVAVVFVCALLLAATAEDQTRVAAITTLPAMLVLLSTEAFSVARLRSKLLVPLALVLPCIWLWKGHNQVSWPYAFLG